MLQAVYLSDLGSRVKTPEAKQEKMARFGHTEEAGLPVGAGW